MSRPRILIDHPWPFFLAHGGFQIQIEQTLLALQALGLDVEFVRWWDDQQQGDLIHFFGRPSARYVEVAHDKGFKVVVADLLGGLGARPRFRRMAQVKLMRLSRWLLPRDFLLRLGWEAFRMADACVALTPWEAHLISEVFDALPARIHVIPNGVEEVFFAGRPGEHRGPWLVCTASIIPIKRVVELANAAVVARTPLWVIGKPFATDSSYHREFLHLVENCPDWIRYEGPIADRAKLASAYRSARGFVLLSQYESLSLSALEAAACGCPLLLSDLPWARTTFKQEATYCPLSSRENTAKILRRFYDDAVHLRPPSPPQKWSEVARQLAGLYSELLKK